MSKNEIPAFNAETDDAFKDQALTLPDTRVEIATLQLLYRQSAPAMYFSVLVATLVALALWPVADRTTLGLWCAAIFLAFLGRLLLFTFYARAKPEGDAVLPWRRPYMLSLLFSASVWGVGGLWIMPVDSVLYQAIVYAFLLGMAGSALTAYSAVRSMAMASFVLTLLPSILWFLFQGESAQIFLALGGLLFFVSSHRATRILADALSRSIRLSHALEQARQSAEAASRTDALTGLNNRRAFTELSTACIIDCARRGEIVSALLIDIDHFKQVNDSCGHASGDDALVQLGALLNAMVRPGDICGRLGGEEFGVILPNTSSENAILVAEKIRVAASRSILVGANGDFPISVSIGVTSGNSDLGVLLKRADTAMYRAKMLGRNRLEIEAPEMSDV